MSTDANGLRTLSRAQVEQFRRDGFLVVENLLSDDDMAAVKDRADQIAGGRASHVPDDCVQIEPGLRDGPLPEDRALAVRKLYKLAHYDDVMLSHVRNPRLVNVVGRPAGQRRHQAVSRPDSHEAGLPRICPSLASGLGILA